ncbi:tRNA (adenine(22)-N(1))-methyltransferase [Shewanella intestini]|uniref:SAM-dependent methyltransferase n=1 Tax=Shewanella intestini TaxID=2017544 RepID=A0ABS5I4M4_9GAMM|nr:MULTISPECIES: tRNA (adenine(22)-N(1))-methyltransferase TrmK [Shewanella]MBR9728982.1 SAM-dependent methyltransferase [Shewanella intestini]MRG36952.1 SAM-dependent methyltransferase [Shewanella sp. XMDDZSB0408]
MKLSKRLQKILSMTPRGYQHIWDCCCDHGLLGSALIDHQVAPHIHFVDIVPTLMASVNAKLQQFHPSANWSTHCIDTAALPLARFERNTSQCDTKTQAQQLVIIAGVGADLMLSFIKAIAQLHPKICIDFLLCPVNNSFSLRQTIIELDCRLYQEALIEENGRFYELLLISLHRGNLHNPSSVNLIDVSAVGENMWQQTSTEVATRYLAKTLLHYQRLQQGKRNNVSKIIDAYRAIKLS